MARPPSIAYKEELSELEEMYLMTKKLIEEESRSDPVTEPYLSKYKASIILNHMKCKLVNMIDDISQVNQPFISKIKAMLGIVLLNLGIIAVDTEELSTGDEQLTKCLDTLQDDSLKPDHIITVISALNHLGLLWSHRDQLKRSRDFLEKAESLYINFSSTSSSAVEAYILFSNEGTGTIKSEETLEKVHTLTLYYLAQVYGKLDDHLRSAVYCHSTLKRQLECKEFDPIDWALNAATLSQYFTEKNRFHEARHHLSAASYVLDQYEANLNIEEGKESDEEHKAKKETFHHRQADVARCWSKYGLNLLTSSKERLMAQADDEESNRHTVNEHHFAEIDEPPTATSELWFNSLELSSYEDQVTDQFVLTFDDARKIFVNAQDWVNKAREYYTLEDLASDYVKIIQDYSQLYKFLSFFEEDESRQGRMHKRRIDLLEAVLKELNPQYYLNVCQQLWYEAAETYSDILDIKLHRLQESSERPTPHALQKINSLAEEGIKHFNHFLDSIKEPSTKQLPHQVPAELLRPAMIAYFHVGRLYSKIMSSDKRVQLKNTLHSLDAYSTLVSYCAQDEVAAKAMSLELGVCQEMVLLLPHKIEKLKREIPA